MEPNTKGSKLKKEEPFLLPFKGLWFFIIHPSLWLISLVGILSTLAMGFIIFYQTAHHFWPTGAERDLIYFWHSLKATMWACFALFIAWIFLIPFFLNCFFDYGFRRLLRKNGKTDFGQSFILSFKASLYVFFLTLKWRILWPLLAFFSLFIFPPLAFFFILFGITHLTCIDAADLCLTIERKNGVEKMQWIQSHQMPLFIMSLSGVLLSFFLGIFFIGFLLWFPAMFCGMHLWINRSNYGIS